MKPITIQIPVPLASKLVDAIEVGAEGLDQSDYNLWLTISAMRIICHQRPASCGLHRRNHPVVASFRPFGSADLGCQLNIAGIFRRQGLWCEPYILLRQREDV